MEELDRRMLLGAAGLAGVAAFAARSKAGPLEPPNGDIAPTGKTLQDVYDRIQPLPNGTGDGRTAISGGGPVQISQPGSYVLTGDISVSNTTGLDIIASNVTVDLNGFTIQSSTPSFAGVSIGPSLRGIKVLNGRTSGFNAGVAGAFAVVGLEVTGLVVLRANLLGIGVGAGDARAVTLSDCTIVDTGTPTTGAGSEQFLGVTAIRCSAHESSVQRCRVYGIANAADQGFTFGISVGATPVSNAVVQECTLLRSTNAGIGTGIHFGSSTGVYRGNTVAGFGQSYATGAAINGGGNA